MRKTDAMLSYLLFVLCVIDDKGRHVYHYIICSIELCKDSLRILCADIEEVRGSPDPLSPGIVKICITESNVFGVIRGNL